jgi:hypothetical protein
MTHEQIDTFLRLLDRYVVVQETQLAIGLEISKRREKRDERSVTAQEEAAKGRVTVAGALQADVNNRVTNVAPELPSTEKEGS